MSGSSRNFIPPPSGTGSGSTRARGSETGRVQRIGPYLLQRELGRGSFGVVYLAGDEVGNQVALKVMLPGGEAEDVQRFVREAQLAARFNHPGIVRVLGQGSHHGLPWLALEYCAGSNLRDRLQRGPYSIRESLQVILQLCAALETAHAAGVIHRDLKPANVLLDTVGKVRITDFGLARGQGNEGLTHSGDGLGSPIYMPPEQFEHAKHADVRADVYALGLLLYECLSAERPFEGLTVMEVSQAVHSGIYVALRDRRPEVPLWLATVCERAFARDPTERYSSVRALREALLAGDPSSRAAGFHGAGRGSDRLRGQGFASAHEASPYTSSGPRSKRRRRLVIVFSGTLMGFLLASAAFLVVKHRARQASLASAEAWVRAGDVDCAQDAYATARRAGASVAGLEKALAALEAFTAAESALERNDPRPAQATLDLTDPGESVAPWFAPRRARVLLGLQLRELERGLDPGPELESAVQTLALSEGEDSARDRLARRLFKLALVRASSCAHLDEVLELLDPAIRLASAPELKTEFELEHADVHFRRGRFPRALELAEALFERPGEGGLKARYLAAYSKLWLDERTSEGLNDMWALRARDPEGPVGLNAGAVSLGHRSEPVQALALVSEALELDPDDLQIRITYAFVNKDRYLVNRDRTFLERSFMASSAAIAERPDDPRGYMARAQAMAADGKLGKALQAYSRAIELTAPLSYVRALRTRFSLYAQLGRGEDAIRDMDCVLEQHPGGPSDLFRRGVVHYQLGHRAKATRDWKAGSRSDPALFAQIVKRYGGALEPLINEALETE